MPYMIVKEGDQWVTYKHDMNHKPMGDPHGHFKTRKEALAQMRALYAAENSKKSLPNSVGNILAASLTEGYNEDADTLMMMGYLNQEQRMQVQSALNNLLGAFAKELGDVYTIQVGGDDVDAFVDDEEDDSCDGSMMGGDMMDGMMSQDVIYGKAVENLGGKRVERNKLPDSVFVFPDERTFPIVTPKSVMAAVHRWGTYKGKHSHDEFVSKLTALAHKLGAAYVAELPAEWDKKQQSKALAELILYSAAKSLYDSSSGYGLSWVGVSHNAWKDDADDIIPLDLIMADIEYQKGLIETGKKSQFGEGLWLDHDENKVIGTCIVREVMEGGRSCIEGGQLKSGYEGLNGAKMSIGYKALMLGGEYILFYTRERSALKATYRVNGRTFFSVKSSNLLKDAAINSIAEDISAYLEGRNA